MKSKILFIARILFALMFINAGLNKFFMYLPNPEMSEGSMNLMTAFIESGWLMPLVASIELIAGILLIIPKTTALGAIMFVPLTIGIFLYHAVLDPETVIISIVLLLLNAIFIIDKKEKYLPLIQ